MRFIRRREGPGLCAPWCMQSPNARLKRADAGSIIDHTGARAVSQWAARAFFICAGPWALDARRQAPIGQNSATCQVGKRAFGTKRVVRRWAPCRRRPD